MLVETAHPAKFNEIVEPLIGREIPVLRLWRGCSAYPDGKQRFDRRSMLSAPPRSVASQRRTQQILPISMHGHLNADIPL